VAEILPRRSRVLLVVFALTSFLALISAEQAAAGQPVRVGIYQNDPKIFLDAAGEPKGFFPEIIDYLGQTLEWDVDYVPCEWATCLEMLQAGELDLMPDVAYSKERAQRFKFGHEAVLHGWSYIYSKEGTVLASLNGLDGHRVAVLKDSIQHAHVRSLSEDRGWSLQIVETNSLVGALTAVQEGRADFGIVNRFFAQVHEHEFDLERSQVLLRPSAIYLAYSNAFDDQLIGSIDATIGLLKTDPQSIYYRAFRNWLTHSGQAFVPVWVYWSIGALVIVVAGSILGNAFLRHRVAQATSALAKSEQRFKDFATASADRLWEMDENLRFTWVQDSVGLGEQESFEGVVGKTRWEIVGIDSDQDEIWRAHRADLEARRPFRDFDYRAKTGARSYIWWRVSGVPIFSRDGSFEGYRGTATAITERKSLEDRLRRAQRLEAVGQLTGGIAHDFNNILAVLLGSVESLKIIKSLAEDEKALPWLASIERAVARGSSLTSRLLSFSRQQALSPLPVDVQSVIRGLEDMLRRTLGETIELTIRGVTGLYPAMIDPHQFENAIINLVINARDAMPNGGTLVIKTTNVTLDENSLPTMEQVAAGDYVEVAVSDSGVGIPPPDLEKVFEPFFTTKDVGKGSGLGLSMVHGFVKQSNGYIAIESEVGQGTTVKLYLPRSKQAVDPKDHTVGIEVLPGGAERILVVEDDESVRQVSVHALRNQGYEVVEEASGRDAINRLKVERSFDLLFTDMVLPGGIDGATLAAEAARLQPSIKVLYTTGYSNVPTLNDEQLNLQSNVIRKPYRRLALLKMVRAILDGEPNHPGKSDGDAHVA